MSLRSESLHSLNIQNSIRIGSIASNDPLSDDPIREEATLNNPILAINYKSKTLGGAYWRSDDSTLIILGDIQCGNVADILDLGIHFLKPIHCS
jgi:hypothetical protein